MPVAGEPMIRRIVAWLVGERRRRSRAQPAPSARDAHRGPRRRRAISARASATRGSSRRCSAAPAARVSRAPIVGADTFFIVNGDTLTDVDLAQLADAHAASGALVTLALVPNREFLRYGGVALDGDGRVTGFVRRGPAAEGSYHFIGVQVVAGARLRRRRAGRAGQLDRRRLRRADRDRSRARCAASISGRGVLRRRHAGRLLAHVAGVRGGGRPAGSSEGRGVESTRPRASRSRFCGTMWRWAPARSSTNASSPTASACRRARRTGGRFSCAARTAARALAPLNL